MTLAPLDGAANVPLTQTLQWRCGDPDGDPVIYTVAFGPSSSPPAVATDLTTTTFDPGPLASHTTYYWVITATDCISEAVGPLWSFITADQGADRFIYIPVVLNDQ